MIVCIAGKNNIAVEILIYLVQIGIKKENIYIISNKTDDGKDNWQRSLLKKANKMGIEIRNLEDVYSIENLLFLSLEFDKIVNPNKFKSNKLFNIHFSLLPKYKGMFTSIMPILNNEKVTGVTLHKIDKGIDTGEIIAQKEFEIDLMDNARDVYHKYIHYGILLLKECLEKLLKNEFIESKPQNLKESSYFSKNSIDFKYINIDLNQTAINIHNQIRAFNFREYQVPKVFDTKIISSKPLNSSSNKQAGSVLFENDICFTISTIDNDIVLYKDKVKELFLACKNGSNELINRLLQIPKIIDVQDENGWTPLIIAIYNNQKEVVKTLLMNGANLSICNFKGTTPLMYAKSAYVKYKDPEIIKLLVSLDVNIYQKDYTNKNVLDYCLENNKFELLDIIKENKK
ncbi:ankyrin repeat domain-containing protein [Aliarcobacter skirrowii]|uniref:ankyrin repeat domain-containing protein n=1 Tax=Aliarcobacter skirrowii TaxID=28200 RepID=UPI0029B8DF0F|nr:ankyrin repeat domain-containing protein [Aliarcobacter skirrowii]MDX4048714.1 ankyrin repeat domain-containing protein [Aliarcobacter skirrowii]